MRTLHYSLYMTAHFYKRSRAALATVMVMTVTLGTASAQTTVTPPKNKYSPADDVKLGLEAAAQARKELPMYSDERVRSYVEELGRRLVAVIPGTLQHPEFRYTFEVVNQQEINAFALPGGPMFVNRGMMEAAHTEGEVVGVMAHELSHVLLRHGTAQATKGEKFQIGAIVGQIAGAVVGGTLGSVIAQGSNIGISTYFMKFSREYEKQADLMGAQLMARAGYDPRDMANMFKTIEKEGGSGPQWLSDHPNPGNRAEYITQEAQALKVGGSSRSNAEFTQIQARLKAAAPAYTAEQIAQMPKKGRVPASTSGRAAVRVEAPSTQYKSYRAGNVLELSVPANWKQAQTGSTVMFVPDGALVDSGGGTAFTHGVEVGVAQSQTGNLQRDTDALLQSFAKNNPQLRRSGTAREDNIDGHRTLVTTLGNVSDVTGAREYISVATLLLRDGSMVYLIGVSPESETAAYDSAFRQVRRSIRVKD